MGGNTFIKPAGPWVNSKPTIDLAIGDDDTGLKWKSDGIISFWGNSQEIGTFGADGMSLKDNHIFEFGKGQPKEGNSGKMGYQVFTGDSLDIVGAGQNAGSRKVHIFDDLNVGNNINAANIHTDGGISTNGGISLNGGISSNGDITTNSNLNSNHLTTNSDIISKGSVIVSGSVNVADRVNTQGLNIRGKQYISGIQWGRHDGWRIGTVYFPNWFDTGNVSVFITLISNDGNQAAGHSAITVSDVNQAQFNYYNSYFWQGSDWAFGTSPDFNVSFYWFAIST
jgi:hypothetical protein